MTKRKVLIYRNELLPSSETFILSQVNTLKNFKPVFAGLKRVSDSLDIGKHPVVVAAGSGAWKEKARNRLFLRAGLASRFIFEI